MHISRQAYCLALLFHAFTIGMLAAQSPSGSAGDGPATQGIGLIRNDPGVYGGYTLISPL